MTTQETGAAGEKIAALYLSSHGYDIRECNVHFRKLEIDIVAYDRALSMMVFVEVKTRGTHSAAYPIHSAVDARKKKNMRKAVTRWVNLHRYEGCGRIDVLSVCHGKVVEHIKDLGSDFY
ncbi:YraN family protein [Candidatus Peribacteria bacterium]|nr:YraN family protein [Candidatus Peribacteria bacterium]